MIVAIALSEIAAAPARSGCACPRDPPPHQGDQERLACALPVYALFTKADLIAGFTEFFDDLDREKRGQVWGATFPLTKREAGTGGVFGAEFQLLIERLNSRFSIGCRPSAAPTGAP